MATKLDVPGAGPALHLGSDEEGREHQALIDARHRFVMNYMKAKGWGDTVEDLSIPQLMEIREAPGWKFAGRDGDGDV